MDKHPNIIICGNYGATNLGDEAILESILETVRKVEPKAVIKVMSSHPQTTATLHHVGSMAMMPAGFRSFFGSWMSGSRKRIIENFKWCDAVIFGGGGLFTDEKPQAILIWLMQILPAIRLKKKIFCFGQSIGPLQHWWSRAIVKFVFKRIDIITVRDEASEKLLEKLGIGDVRVLPDPVFGLQKKYTAGNFSLSSNKNSIAADSSKMMESCKKENIFSENIPGSFVVFSIRPWLNQSEKFFKTFAEFVDWIYEKYDFKSVMVPFQKNGDDDEMVMKKIAAKVKNPCVEILPYDENFLDVLSCMKVAEAVVGMRLHSLIFSSIVGTPFLSLSYSQKVHEVVSQLGMEKTMVVVGENKLQISQAVPESNGEKNLQLEDLQKAFTLLMSEHEKMAENLASKQQIFADRINEYVGLLKSFLAAGKK